jgi:hypothetical protein
MAVTGKAGSGNPVGSDPREFRRCRAYVPGEALALIVAPHV